MAPIATADLVDDGHREANEYSAVLPKKGDSALYALWYEHGHPWSEKYANPDLTSLPNLLPYNATRRPTGLAFLVPDGDSFARISWLEFDRKVNALTATYSRLFEQAIRIGIDTKTQPTIALLGHGVSIDYFATQLALLKLGVRVLLLAPSNADAARDHLLSVCGAAGIVTQPELLRTMDQIKLPVVLLQCLEEVVHVDGIETELLRFEAPDVWESHSLIIHSSGTTGMPKPIIHTHRSMMMIARMYRLFPDFAINNWYLAFPLYHIAGISIALSGLPNGLTLTFPPLNWPPAPSAILSAFRQLKKIAHPGECLHCAPAVIEDLYEYIAQTDGDFSPLVQLKVLQPGGAALSAFTVNKLVAAGINVKTTYGSTEIGPPWRSIPHSRDNPHCYRVRCLYPKSQYLEMQPQGDGLFEVVVHKGFPLAAELWPDTDTPKPYRTNDLFTEEPPGSGQFVLQGRKDDLLIHSNGEKTNALPLQMALDSSPRIRKAAVFGNGRAGTSAIIEPSSFLETAPEKDALLDEVERICLSFPTHSRIQRCMVHILSQGESLATTPKGSVRRKVVEEAYGSQLAALYEQLENGEGTNVGLVQDSSLSDAQYIAQVVQSVLGLTDPISEDANVYRLGLDSQKAIRLRSLLLRRFDKFPMRYLFEYPSIAALEKNLGSQSSSCSQTASSRTEQHHEWMKQAISRYTAEIKSWTRLASSGSQATDGEVIYLTGATGALGNALLEAFVADPGIRKVYCAIRGDHNRITGALLDRGYSGAVAFSPKLEVVPYDMPAENLGLDAGTYAKLAIEVTLVFHNAWKMDFNTPVHEFEQDCVAGTMKLLRFSNTGRPKAFAFPSSVAAHLGPASAGTEIAEEEAPNEPHLALGTGYAQSKLTVEILLQVAARHLQTPVKVFRIGQLSGHSRSGAWNETEMFPIMLASGLKHLKALPVIEGEVVDWLPVDTCAQAIRQLLLLPRRSAGDIRLASQVHNLVNPQMISWTAFLDALETASEVPFERLSMPQWYERLQKACESDGVIPGAKLLSFFEEMAQAKPSQRPIFATKRTRSLTPVLDRCKALDFGMLRLYLERWRESGFI